MHKSQKETERYTKGYLQKSQKEADLSTNNSKPNKTKNSESTTDITLLYYMCTTTLD